MAELAPEVVLEEHHHVISTPIALPAEPAATAPEAAIAEHVARAEAAAHSIEHAVDTRTALAEIVAPIATSLNALTSIMSELVTKVDGLAVTAADVPAGVAEKLDEVAEVPMDDEPEVPAPEPKVDPKRKHRR